MTTRPSVSTLSSGSDPAARGDASPCASSPANLSPAKPSLRDLDDWHQESAPLPHERTSDRRAAFMFYVALATLALIGLMAGHGISGDANELMFGWWLGIPLLGLWVIVILEGLLGMATVRQHPAEAFKRFLLTTLCPPFRAAFASAYPGRFLWIPRHGWLAVGKLNYQRVELRFAIPMLCVTLLVLPLLGIELFLSSWLEQHLWAAAIVHTLTAFIWFAFAAEFIIMLSLTDKKLAYCKTHWVNIAIIILPLIAFLRIIRLFRFFRFIRFGRSAKLLRAYRLRGVVARTMRLAMVFNLIDRLLERNPQKYLETLQEKVEEKQSEIRDLEAKMVEVRARIAAQNQTAPAQAPDTETPAAVR